MTIIGYSDSAFSVWCYWYLLGIAFCPEDRRNICFPYIGLSQNYGILYFKLATVYNGCREDSYVIFEESFNEMFSES
jgi:hypothetical protein